MKEFEVDINTFSEALNINGNLLRRWLNYNWKLQAFTKRKRNAKYRYPLMHVTINDEFKKLFLEYLSQKHREVNQLPPSAYAQNFLKFIEAYDGE